MAFSLIRKIMNKINGYFDIISHRFIVRRHNEVVTVEVDMLNKRYKVHPVFVQHRDVIEEIKKNMEELGFEQDN